MTAAGRVLEATEGCSLDAQCDEAELLRRAASERLDCLLRVGSAS